MTVDTNNNEPYNESKEHVLSHYFDELLPSDTTDNDAEAEVHDKAPAELIPEHSQPFTNETKPTVENSGIEPPEPNQPEPIAAIDIARPEAKTALKASESLAPLADIQPAASENDSAAYQAHKQRLEKMLQQLAPVNPLLSLSESKVLPVKSSEAEALKETSTDTHAEVEVPNPQPLLEQTVPLSSEWLDNGRPNWAQETFDILLIDVNGLKLALPLVALGHIEPIEEDLTPLFGQSEWFLGLQKTPFGNIKTIDTAQYVMPEKTLQDNDNTYKFVVSISGMNWGLAVDSIDQPIAIDPETIRWRAKRSNRPWMAGTVKDHMCVLLDIPVMGELLQKEDQNHHNPTGE